MTFYTGITRSASDILEKQQRAVAGPTANSIAAVVTGKASNLLQTRAMLTQLADEYVVPYMSLVNQELFTILANATGGQPNSVPMGYLRGFAFGSARIWINREIPQVEAGRTGSRALDRG